MCRHGYSGVLIYYYSTCYTLEELKQRPLPSEVDPTKMETYLSDKDFLVSFVHLNYNGSFPCEAILYFQLIKLIFYKQSIQAI